MSIVSYIVSFLCLRHITVLPCVPLPAAARDRYYAVIGILAVYNSPINRNLMNTTNLVLV